MASLTTGSYGYDKVLVPLSHSQRDAADGGSSGNPGGADSSPPCVDPLFRMTTTTKKTTTNKTTTTLVRPDDAEWSAETRATVPPTNNNNNNNTAMAYHQEHDDTNQPTHATTTTTTITTTAAAAAVPPSSSVSTTLLPLHHAPLPHAHVHPAHHAHAHPAHPRSLPLLSPAPSQHHRSVSSLTLPEKLSLLSGKSLWHLADLPRCHLSSLVVSDGPHGIRKLTAHDSYLHESFPATCFPTACAMACSWNVPLCRNVGYALAQEAWHYNIQVVLGPGLNLKRHAGGGRNFEYFAEDPLLSGRLAAAYIQGIQTPIDLASVEEKEEEEEENSRRKSKRTGGAGAKGTRSSSVSSSSSSSLPWLPMHPPTSSPRQSSPPPPPPPPPKSSSPPHQRRRTSNETTGPPPPPPPPQSPPQQSCPRTRRRYGHVGACAKHFCVNNQESHRFVVDAMVDERTLRELYYRGFEYVVTGQDSGSGNIFATADAVEVEAAEANHDDDDDKKDDPPAPRTYDKYHHYRHHQQPATIMCAYNKVNGEYCSEHASIMTQLLRQEWKFRGVVMTDWGATNDRLAGILAGVDLEMPGSHGVHDRSIKQGLRNNHDAVQRHIDICAQRMLDLITTYQGASVEHAAATLEGNSHDVHNYDHLAYPIDWDAHNELARQAARDCIVLLQNRNNLLPLPCLVENGPSTTLSLAVIGAFARDAPRFQGMGSSQVHPHQVVTAYEELKKYTDQITYAPGYIVDEDVGVISQPLLTEAVQVAQDADVVLFFCGLDAISESEGFDRTELCLPAQHVALMEQLCRVHDKVVIILSNGGAVELPAFCLEGAAAILEGYLLGQAGGGAVVDILFGLVSPSGKLSETMPEKKTDILADRYFPGDRHAVEYREGLDVGYRYFDTVNKPVRFPFGHGLSYTTFDYSNLQVKVLRDEDSEKEVEVSFQIANIGSMAGCEVAQCYVRDMESSVYRPTHELRDFDKIFLKPGEQKTVVMLLNRFAFTFYDIGAEDWVVEPGSFEIQIGSSSRDIRLRQTFEFGKGRHASNVAKTSYPPVIDGTLSVVDDITFTKRFGPKSLDVLEKIVDRNNQSLRIFNRNSLLKEVAENRLLGKIFFTVVYSEACKEVKPGHGQERQKKMVQANVENLPLRALVLFSQGALSFVTLDACIAFMNRRPLGAIHGFLTAFALSVVDVVRQIIKRR